MKITLTRSGTVIAAFAGLLAAAPAMAFTHHPSTPAERAQTRQLNLQALQQAQAQAPSNMQANLGAQGGAQSNAGANMGASGMTNGGASMNAPNENMNNNSQAKQPMSNDESSQPTTSQTPMPDQKPAAAPSGY